MKNYIISIILPVYNGSEFIDKCMNSLIQQTIFEDLQIIIIDDGSSDQSLELLKRYEKQYENIEVFHTENRGVSHARNIGMGAARGEYVTFVDIDDWVDPICYKEMCITAQKTKADIVAAGLYICDDEKDIVERKITEKEQIITCEIAILDYLTEKIDVHCCNKIFKTELIRIHMFDSKLKIAEDRWFLYECILSSKRIVLMERSFYHYYQNPSSVMNQKFSEKNIDGLYVAKRILHMTTKKYPEMKGYAEAMYMSTACRLYCEMSCETKYKKLPLYNELMNQVKKYKITDAKKHMSKKHFIALIFAKLNPRIFNVIRKNTYIKFVK